ncbi:MAG: tyrosine-protein phosphatase [Enterococcus sp.]
MIDLHCHILPGVDDGPATLAESLEMAQQAVEQGITHILCTPHHQNGKYINEKQSVIQAVAFLQTELDQRGIPLTLFEGQEIRINGSLVTEIQQEKILFTDVTNRYLLIELPTLEIPAYTEQLFFELISSGKVPIIVHPERNAKFRANPNHLRTFLAMGALAQVTAPSYVGIFGKSIQKTAQQMVAANLVQMLASDAHGESKRKFYLQAAYQKMAQDFGQEKVNLMQQVAKDLINGDALNYPAYQKVPKKRFELF